MKILRLIHTLDPLSGGPVEGIRMITPHLSSLGVETTVACLDPPNSNWLNDPSFKTYALGPVCGGYGYRRGLVDHVNILASQHDLIIIHGLWQYHGLATWRALKGSSIPYCVYTHGMLDPWFKRTYPFKHLKKWLYWASFEYRVLRDAEFVFYTTEQERLLARQSFWLYKANEIVVGYGTTAPSSDSERQQQVFLDHFPHLNGKRILLFLSRIHPKKGVDLLIEAFAIVHATNPELRLVIAGPDQVGIEGDLQNKARELGVADCITWPGMLSGDLKWGAFRCAELFCLPSHQENFGIVVAEALACGLPVAIAEPVNIAADVAAAGAGLVHADTAAGATDAMRQWLALSAEEKWAMGQRGEELFRERFDFASIAHNLLPLLKAAIKRQ